MCATVKLGGSLIESQAEIKAALGSVIYLPDAPIGARDDDNGCLCWVDIPAMAEREKMFISREDDGDYVLTPKTKAAL